ncbi:stage II sporulation protein R [Clostridium sp.]|uniref:stage II sporulation protein R n=1 Tax=Clostridium sp. TaxID=1506 RepID=UPI003F30AB51
MKKYLMVILLIIVTIGSTVGCVNSESGQGLENKNELIYEDIVDEIIRFHVIANSDSEEDQALKLKVRDEIIKYTSEKISKSSSLEDAREIILENQEEINEIAKNVVKENGYDYPVESTLSRENFPDKMYGDLIFPQGEYEAFRVLIGSASGQNWWCVMFPPLCFVDETKDAVDSNKTEENLEQALNGDDKGEKKIQFKSKIMEKIKSKDKKVNK